MNSKVKGNVCVGAVVGKLLKDSATILLPVGDNERYDLVVDRGGTFVRVQCKLGRLEAGATVLIFNTCSTNRSNGKWVRNCYRGQIDIFGVYCPEIDKVYMVPVDSVGVNSGRLRLKPAKNHQLKGLLEASDYEVS